MPDFFARLLEKTLTALWFGFGQDYHPHLSRAIDELMTQGKKDNVKGYYFCGWDMGGVFAALQVARVVNTQGVVFGAPPMDDIFALYGYRPTKRVRNLALEGDVTPFEVFGERVKEEKFGVPVCVFDGGSIGD